MRAPVDRVVPLHVVVAGTTYREGLDVTTAEVAAALREFRPVTPPGRRRHRSSRPTSGRRRGRDGDRLGAPVRRHVGHGRVGAMLAAGESPVPVQVVDSRSSAWRWASPSCRCGRGRGQGADANSRCAAGTLALLRQRRCCFYVDTLEHLRRGGRIGAASALLGSALAIKPLLTLQRRAHRAGGEGAHGVPRAGPDGGARGARGRRGSAARWMSPCTTWTPSSTGRWHGWPSGCARSCRSTPDARLVELGAVVGAHVGPGTIALVVSPRPERRAVADVLTVGVRGHALSSPSSVWLVPAVVAGFLIGVGQPGDDHRPAAPQADLTRGVGQPGRHERRPVLGRGGASWSGCSTCSRGSCPRCGPVVAGPARGVRRGAGLRAGTHPVAVPRAAAARASRPRWARSSRCSRRSRWRWWCCSG